MPLDCPMNLEIMPGENGNFVLYDPQHPTKRIRVIVQQIEEAPPGETQIIAQRLMLGYNGLREFSMNDLTEGDVLAEMIRAQLGTPDDSPQAA